MRKKQEKSFNLVKKMALYYFTNTYNKHAGIMLKSYKTDYKNV